MPHMFLRARYGNLYFITVRHFAWAVLGLGAQNGAGHARRLRAPPAGGAVGAIGATPPPRGLRLPAATGAPAPAAARGGCSS